MKQITNKEEEFQKYKRDKLYGHILPPNRLRFILEANEYDAQKIGQRFWEMLPKIREWTKQEYESYMHKQPEYQSSRGMNTQRQ